jgi:hypothetical protein
MPIFLQPEFPKKERTSYSSISFSYDLLNIDWYEIKLTGFRDCQISYFYVPHRGMDIPLQELVRRGRGVNQRRLIFHFLGRISCKHRAQRC